MSAMKTLIKAAQVAAEAHCKQLCKDGFTPYVNHPIGVAYILVELGNVTDLNVIIAALLHDTVEQSNVTFEDVKRDFGDKVCSIVMEVTDDKTHSLEEQRKQQIDRAARMSTEAKLVRLADKLYNLRDVTRYMPVGWNEEKLKSYVEWSTKVITGCKGTSKEIEEELSKTLAKLGITWK